MPFLLFCFLYQPNRETLVKITKTLSFLKQLVRAEQSALAQKGPSGYIPRNCSLFALESDRTKCAFRLGLITTCFYKFAISGCWSKD